MKTVNDSFICVNCWKEVSPASRTCRNHCPYCFVSMHVDDKLPWDRLSTCHGKMYPIEYEISNWELRILFKCEKCGKKHRNKSVDDDNISLLDDIVYKYKNLLS